VAWVLAGVAVLVQMLTNGRYGYFRDELYYLAASDHLAFGYVDFAPLIAGIAYTSRKVLGDSLHAIRVVPALAFGVKVLLTGLFTRELCGKRWAVLLGCVSVLSAPVILGATRLAMNPIEPLFLDGLHLFRAARSEPPTAKAFAVVQRVARAWARKQALDSVLPRRTRTGTAGKFGSVVVGHKNGSGSPP